MIRLWKIVLHYLLITTTMNQHFKKSITLIKEIYTRLKKIIHEYSVWYKEQSRKKQSIIALLALVVFIIILKMLFGGSSEVKEEEKTVREVEVASLTSLSGNENSLLLVGNVTSLSEATIRAETSGRLTRVYRKLGDTVVAGQTIAEFENSGERASVLQAEGAYEQVKAGRDIALLNSGQAGSSLSEIKNQALSAISGSYSTLDDAIRGKTDQAYSDPTFEQLKLLLFVPDATLSISLESKRKAIEMLLKKRAEKNKTLTESSDLVSELTLVQNELETVKVYLDDLFSAYSKALPNNNFTQSTLDTNKLSVQAARQAVIGSLNSIASTRLSLSQSITASKVAGSGQTEKSGSILSAEAQVKQALGAYNAALSRLEKTIIRSPITGTLNSLSIQTGDYVSSFTQVAVVSNNGSLEIVSFVTEDDARRIKPFNEVLINGTYPGVVSRIASALDPVTKKIEVRVSLKERTSTLVNGQSVRVKIIGSKNENIAGIKKDTPLIIPIAALKLTPRGANVFTVSTTSTLIAVPVKEGAILGDQIQILEGLAGDEILVKDARGLKEGIEVSIKEEK